MPAHGKTKAKSAADCRLLADKHINTIISRQALSEKNATTVTESLDKATKYAAKAPATDARFVADVSAIDESIAASREALALTAREVAANQLQLSNTLKTLQATANPL